MTRLAHVNIRTSRLADSVAFYRDVLGLSPSGAATRPGSADHVWMRDEQGNPCVHLQRTEADAVDSGGVGLHHIAFDCEDPDGWRRELQRHAIPFDEHVFDSAGMLQFNLRDPEGVRIELTFAQERK